jgi:rare lipoprotein A
VHLIGKKLIAPMIGAIVVAGGIAIASASANGSLAAPPPAGTPSGASSPQSAGTPSDISPPQPAAGLSGSTSSPAGSADALIASHVLARDVLVDHSVAVAGALAPSAGSQRILLEQRIRDGWSVVARSSSLFAGPFRLAFRPRRLGVHAMRVQIASNDGVYDSPTTTVTVFHEVLVSWYGPGGTTACGQELTSSTLGVANRTLPCGTLVTLRYGQRTIRVPVIDRGPYVAGRAYDLTWATRERLGAGDLTVLWANH